MSPFPTFQQNRPSTGPNPNPGVGNTGGGGVLRFPRFRQGNLGPMHWWHWNSLFEAVENLYRPQGVGPYGSSKSSTRTPFIGTIFNRLVTPGWPLDTKLAWEEVKLTDDGGSGLVYDTGASGQLDFRSSRLPGGVGADDFFAPGVVLHPPNGLMFAANTDTGQRRYVHMPAPSVYVCQLFADSPFPGGTYSLFSLDASISRTNITPDNRWPNVTYSQPASVGLLLVAPEFPGFPNGVSLWANEFPDLNACPAASPAAAPPSSFSAAPFAVTGGL